MNWEAVIELLYVFEKVQAHLQRRYPGLSPEDIEDCIQESMVIAARKLGDGTVLENDDPAAYCFGIILQTARRHLLKKLRTRAQPAKPDAQAAPDLFDPLSRLIQQQQIAQALTRCSDEDEAVLRMIFWDDMTQEEVGRHYDVSKSTISRRLKRILGLLEDSVG